MADVLDDYITTRAEDSRPCGYLNGHLKTDMRLAFNKSVDVFGRMLLAEQFFNAGFFHDGRNELVKSICTPCDACKPVRYPVDAFKRSASQEALWRQNATLKIFLRESFGTQEVIREHASLCGRHHAARFPHMFHADDDPTLLIGYPFLHKDKLPITILELREADGTLVGASLNAETENTLAGILYYYDPEQKKRQLGKQIILSLLQAAKQLGKDYLYVGPWVDGNNHLAPKTQFRPYELYHKNKWHRFETPVPSF